ncbi:amidohydrolase family protein [Bailinhaonella thermotolerans]|uniref:Amidohydrolase n=1 Tax=Bailinhaonella thermotolerans TaxID=1070861 RepID=A0A3A4AUP7_9ACTN|nr:amidohydrolase family protein [Bailinhaonella thermotolerans]RJL32431.1 amidohydrolase [Bailinhaonella thermotolerans]
MALHVRGVVLPGDEVRDVYLVGDRVTFEPVPGAETVASGGFVLPGLVDAHCHIGIRPGSAPVESVDEARALAMLDRDAGVLAMRDAGSPYPYPELDDDPEMPRLSRAGTHIAPPRRYLRGLFTETPAEELTSRVLEQARAGNGWVKIVADWIDRETGDLGPTYDFDTLKAAVDMAHRAGARVAVHTFDEKAVEACVRAGADSIEHGTGLTVELAETMASEGAALVPTMINVETFEGIAARADGKFPAYAAHMRRLQAGFPEVVRAAYESGAQIFAGTDAGGGIDHGLLAEEMMLLHEKAGMRAVDVLAAASWRARAWLGLPGLVEGGFADLVVYESDPREDLSVVRTPSRVVLRGRVVR